MLVCLLNSVISQIFITPDKESIEKLSNVLKNYMTIDKDQFVFPLNLKRKLKGIVIDKVWGEFYDFFLAKADIAS